MLIKPLIKRWPELASTDPVVIDDWWYQWPDADVGLLTGDGLLVLDEDQPGALAKLEEGLGVELPMTAKATTCRGVHLFLEYPPELDIRTSTKPPGPPGVDVKAEGGFVVLPSPKARNREWIRSGEVADAPQELLELLVAERPRSEALPPEEWVELLEGIDDGARNVSLTRLTGYLLRHYVAVDVTAALIHLVNKHRCHPPKPRAEVDRTIDSVARAELKRRQGRRT